MSLNPHLRFHTASGYSRLGIAVKCRGRALLHFSFSSAVAYIAGLELKEGLSLLGKMYIVLVRDDPYGCEMQAQ